jgi:hypothetical protein
MSFSEDLARLRVSESIQDGLKSQAIHRALIERNGPPSAVKTTTARAVMIILTVLSLSLVFLR